MATILIVDDRPSNRDLLVTILGYRKHHLLQASDGAEALQIARDERPDLIISDILMPSMDGFEFVRQLRADPRIAQTKVIFFTAHYLMREAQGLALTCGVTQVLSKPAEPEEIYAAVDAALGIAGLPQTMPVSVPEFDREHLSVITTKLAVQADVLRSTQERMSALIELGQDLGQEKDISRLIENFCAGARKIVGSKYAAIVIVNDSGKLKSFANCGLDAVSASQLSSPNPNAALPTLLLKSRATQIVNEVKNLQDTGLPPNFPPVHAILGATISSLSTIYGWVCFVDKIGVEQFTAEDEKLSLVLSSQLGRIYETLERNVAELSQSERRYRRLFESAKDGVLILDAQTGKITDANPYIFELLGYSHAELIGKELWELGLFIDVEASRAAMRELQEKHYIRYEDLALRTKAGRRIDVEFISNVYSEDHHSVIQCNIRDITERRRAAEQLANEDRRKDEFLAMLAHELRNPLTPIKTAALLLRLAKVENPIVVRTQEIIERQANHMIRLVDDLLDISRLQRGKVRLKKEILNLTTAVSDAVDCCNHLITSHNHQIILNLQGKPPIFIEADPTRVTQIIANILVNAAKYTPKGGVIRVTTVAKNGMAIVRIRDNGAGIEAGMLNKIFDVYTQVEQSLDRSQGGLGLGLKLVKELVILHGGTVEAVSKGLGKGSEFVIHFPLVPAPVSCKDILTAQPRHQSISRRVLLIEDSADTRESMEMLLMMHGHRIDTAEDGFQGVGRALETLPDVALIDIGLPVLNGYEVAKAIRAGAHGDKIVLIALTGYGQAEDKQRAMEAGFDDHLTKPATEVELFGILNDLEKYHRVGV